MLPWVFPGSLRRNPAQVAIQLPAENACESCPGCDERSETSCYSISHLMSAFRSTKQITIEMSQIGAVWLACLHSRMCQPSIHISDLTKSDGTRDSNSRMNSTISCTTSLFFRKPTIGTPFLWFNLAHDTSTTKLYRTTTLVATSPSNVFFDFAFKIKVSSQRGDGGSCSCRKSEISETCPRNESCVLSQDSWDKKQCKTQQDPLLSTLIADRLRFCRPMSCFNTI